MLLAALSQACGIAGQEDEVRGILTAHLRDAVDEIWSDSMGNLLVRKGSGPVRVMLDAHMDEVGFCVGAITDAGYLRLKKVGGIDDRVLPGRQVWATNRRIPGVIGVKAFHLVGPEERGKGIHLDQMYVDLGCQNRAEVESLGVEPGDPVYFATDFAQLSPTVVKGKAMDDRAGCALLALLLQRFQHPGVTLYGAFTTQEEIGRRGARAAAYYLDPDLAVAIDVTPAGDGPDGARENQAATMGGGPVLYLLDGNVAPHQDLVDQIRAVAAAATIPYQFRRGQAGATNSSAIAAERGGIPSCALSLPARYIHSAASLLDLGDFDAGVRLLDGFLAGVEKGDYRRA